MLSSYAKNAPRESDAWSPRTVAAMLEDLEKWFKDTSAQHSLVCGKHPFLCSFDMTIRFVRANVMIPAVGEPEVEVFTNFGPVELRTWIALDADPGSDGQCS